MRGSRQRETPWPTGMSETSRRFTLFTLFSPERRNGCRVTTYSPHSHETFTIASTFWTAPRSLQDSSPAISYAGKYYPATQATLAFHKELTNGLGWGLSSVERLVLCAADQQCKMRTDWLVPAWWPILIVHACSKFTG